MRRRERAGDSLQAVRAALAGLGSRGRTTRIPDGVRARVLAYARRQRAAGATWQMIGATVGVSASALKNWSETPPRARALVPVVVTAAGADQSTAPLVVVSPAGYRIEGLDLATATALLRALA